MNEHGENEWTDDMWFMDVPITLQAYEEDVQENWAPRWTRCWGLQMQNAIMYIDSLERVHTRAWRRWLAINKKMKFRNRQRPRAFRRQGSWERQLLSWRRLYLRYMRDNFKVYLRNHNSIFYEFNGNWNNPYILRDINFY